MRITAIEVESHTRQTVRIQTAAEGGIDVIVGTQREVEFTLGQLTGGSPVASAWPKVMRTAALIYGVDRKGRPAGTSSMIQEVADLIGRVSALG